MDETRNENAYKQTATLAYELWELRGCPEGSPELDWAAAEEVLASSREIASKTASFRANPGVPGEKPPELASRTRVGSKVARRE